MLNGGQRRTRCALALVLGALAFVAAACGGAAKSSSGSGSDDPAQILAGLVTTPSTAPQKVKLEIDFDLTGTPNTMMATAMKKPNHFTVEGVVDAAHDSEDITLIATMDTTPHTVRVMKGDGKMWIQVEDKWYAVSAGDVYWATGGLGPAIDPQRISTVPGMVLAMIGNPTGIFASPSVSHEDVDGVATDRVSGTIDMRGFLAAYFGVGKATDPSSQPLTPSQLEAVASHMEKDVTNARVDLWVGSDDHRAHRVSFAFDVAMDKSEQQASGLPIDRLHMDADASSVDADAPKIAAPAAPGTPEEFTDAFDALARKILGDGPAGG